MSRPCFRLATVEYRHLLNEAEGRVHRRAGCAVLRSSGTALATRIECIVRITGAAYHSTRIVIPSCLVRALLSHSDRHAV